jgi:hypothetical protein
MERIDKNDLVELVDRILSNPVGVEDAESTAMTTNTYLKYKKCNMLKQKCTHLGNRLQITLELERVNTVSDWLAISLTLCDRTLAAASQNSDSVDNVS